MNFIKTMLCGNLIGFHKLERLKLLLSDPLVSELAISIKEPETVSRLSGNRCYNLQLAFCDDIKSFLTGYVRSGAQISFLEGEEYDYFFLKSFQMPEFVKVVTKNYAQWMK